MLSVIKNIAVTSCTLLTLGIHNPAIALVDQAVFSSGLVSINTKKLTPKQSNLVADNTTYWSPQGDCKILMPGIVTDSTEEQLTSVSATSRTIYTIIHKEFPEASRIPIPQVRQVLQSAMRETIGRTGKVIRTTNLVIDGHPGLELLMEHSDESLGQYRAFVVNQHLYFMGAITPNELTTESVNFFDSFRVYPERIRYSSF
ncbi:hypothetical protein LC653_07660 [Nostoc sp. CHAB 5784]|uniref:hypothetical protein n=1 Tax=Nostoc mirabile TaxID=2907820 RepID=UPI001E495442|nr:hypothetical protein [Nostoc mirabile]MCC5663800.1 hypothetical protein [Nostoc mirabile CHAB5784]